jgi:hypothetical protein
MTSTKCPLNATIEMRQKMTTSTTPFTFSYIVIDQKSKDKQGHPMLSIYNFLTQDAHDVPSEILQSSTPSITAKIYAGTPYPNFDFTEAIERRVRLDIQNKYDYVGLVASQINAKEWHLHAITPSSKSELQ